MNRVTIQPLFKLVAVSVFVLCAVEWRQPVAHGSDYLKTPRSTEAPAQMRRAQAVLQAYGSLPLSFELNRGQADRTVDFLARGPGYTVLLSPREAVLSLSSDSTGDIQALGLKGFRSTPLGSSRNHTRKRVVLRMKLVGGSGTANAFAEEELPGKVNYMLGNDPARWRAAIPTYARVTYDDVYPGVDLVYYGNRNRLEYDFIVSPGVDPSVIGLEFQGADRIKVDDNEDLVITIAGREIRQPKPLIYQLAGKARVPIAGGYRTKAGRVSFQIGPYDRNWPLIIDPMLVYSTFLGGIARDHAYGIAVDASGSAYVVGELSDYPSEFPTTSTIGTVGGVNGFVTKLDPTGSHLIYSTVFGGNVSDSGLDIEVDTSGSAYITGVTSSVDFPTVLPFQASYGGGSSDAFVAKLSANGAMFLYSSFLGGARGEGGQAIAIDSARSAYVTGPTESTNFPLAGTPFQSVRRGPSDAFVTKVNPTGSALVYSTYLGGDGQDVFGHNDIAVDAAGQAHVAGGTNSTDFPTTVGAFDTTFAKDDGYITKLNVQGSGLIYSTLLGGDTSGDVAQGIALDSAGHAYITGFTASTDFPTSLVAFQSVLAGKIDGFVTKLHPTGSALVYSTYLGGNDHDVPRRIALDTLLNAYVAGETWSPDFPLQQPFQVALLGGIDDFVTKLNATGSALIYSSYLGGSGNEGVLDATCCPQTSVAVDASGAAYVAGFTPSSDFPTTFGAYDRSLAGPDDAFVVKISDVGAPATLTLDPPAATNAVGTQHCVTATVTDAGGNPVPDVTVRFSVSGSITTSGSATTDANGQAVFCYQGPPLPGADIITAFADTDGDDTQDLGEPSGAATKAWVLPPTTPMCEIRITNGGHITAANGDPASFGGNAKADETGATQGQEQYHDHGPAQPMNVHSLTVEAIVCEGTMQASIFGRATINGAGSFFYRIRVQDLAEPGIGHDTYGILLTNGYNSGEQVLEGGNVQIRR